MIFPTPSSPAVSHPDTTPTSAATSPSAWPHPFHQVSRCWALATPKHSLCHRATSAGCHQLGEPHPPSPHSGGLDEPKCLVACLLDTPRSPEPLGGRRPPIPLPLGQSLLSLGLSGPQGAPRALLPDRDPSSATGSHHLHRDLRGCLSDRTADGPSREECTANRGTSESEGAADGQA